MARQPQPCGTRAAHARHIYHGETPCEPCVEAHRQYKREHALRTGHSRARQRAFARLAQRYPEAFAVLLAQERAKEDRS